MSKVLSFKSCASGGEYIGLGAQTPTTYQYIGIPNASTTIPNAYLSDPALVGKVVGIGNGWQKYVVPSAGKIQFTVRGAAGGCTSNAGFYINPETGAVGGANGNRPGRGAKLQGEGKFSKGDILYLLVGMRGWCNTYRDWGGGGGGASVVLKDNPAGAYTFAPLNRKVDVLFVAGGGGGTYDENMGGNYYGKDAIYEPNGTSTAGGSGSNAGGGAGLTGNGGTSRSNGVAYSLLSGTVPTTSFSSVHYGGWGGGGAPYNGGGGGGGYSGGSTNDGIGGNGGTSYINQSLITETFRGFATPANDSHRNLVNPWTAYGHIELILGRDESKLILAEDIGGYKYFNGAEMLNGNTVSSATDQWELIPSQDVPDELTYLNYGNRVITNADGLDQNVSFLIMSKEEKEQINISANANRTRLEQTKTVSLSDVSLIKSVNFTGNLTNLDVRFIVSKDQGRTWQTYNYGSWDNIDGNNKQDIATNGWPLSQIDTIPIADWNSYKAKTINFCFLVTQNGPNGGTIIDNLTMNVDLLGSWRHFKESEATYEYISDTEAKITFLQAGNYKVNYLDSLNSGESE